MSYSVDEVCSVCWAPFSAGCRNILFCKLSGASVGSSHGLSTFPLLTPWSSVSHSVVSDSLQFHGLQPSRLLCPWDFPEKNTGVGCHFLLQGIFLTLRSNLHFLHWQVNSLPLSHMGSTAKAMRECVHGSVASVVSDSLWLHRLQPSRILCIWNSSCKNTGVGFHALLQPSLCTLYKTTELQESLAKRRSCLWPQWLSFLEMGTEQLNHLGLSPVPKPILVDWLFYLHLFLGSGLCQSLGIDTRIVMSYTGDKKSSEN